MSEREEWTNTWHERDKGGNGRAKRVSRWHVSGRGREWAKVVSWAEDLRERVRVGEGCSRVYCADYNGVVLTLCQLRKAEADRGLSCIPFHKLALRKRLHIITERTHDRKCSSIKVYRTRYDSFYASSEVKSWGLLSLLLFFGGMLYCWIA